MLKKDFDRLSLFQNFQVREFLVAFDLKRTLSFLKSLEKSDWPKQLLEETKKRQETIYWRARG